MRKKIITMFLLCLSHIFLAQAEESPIPPPETALETKPIPSYESTLTKMLLTLGGLLVLVFFTVWILKKIGQGKFGGFGSQKKINIIERKPLSPKTLLYLIEVEGKKILISESQAEVRALVQTGENDLY